MVCRERDPSLDVVFAERVRGREREGTDEDKKDEKREKISKGR